MKRYLNAVEIKGIIERSREYHHPGLYAGMENENGGFVWAVDPAAAKEIPVELHKHGETSPYKWNSGRHYRGTMLGNPFDGNDRRYHMVPCGSKQMTDKDVENFWDAVDGLKNKGERAYFRTLRHFEVGISFGAPCVQGWITKTL